MGLTETRAEIREDDSTLLIVDFFKENINLEGFTDSVSTWNIGTSFVLGHPDNGILGTSAYPLGRDDSNGTVLHRRVNYNNTFIDFFRESRYVGTASTGTLVTSDPDYYYSLTNGQVFESGVVFTNGTAVLDSATPKFYDETGTALLGTAHAIALSSDGGSSWLSAVNGSETTFNNVVAGTVLFPYDFPFLFGEVYYNGGELVARLTASGTARIGKFKINYVTR